MIDSLQTKQTAERAAAAAARWREHWQDCNQCTRATRKGATEPLCATGLVMRASARNQAAALKKAKALDAQPAPGQEKLF